MEVREAVGIAKEYVRELFSDEQIRKLGLEEIDFVDDGPHSHWKITIGFVREWKSRQLGRCPGIWFCVAHLQGRGGAH